MKKSKTIQLVLITAALASCNQTKKQPDWGDDAQENKTHIRSDSTAPYSRVRHHHSSVGNALLWYYAFRPYGAYNNNQYHHAGYYSGAIHHNSNVGANHAKGSVFRGGFGRSGYHSIGG